MRHPGAGPGQTWAEAEGCSKTPVGSAVMDAKEVEGLGPDELPLLLLLLLLSNRAEDCSGRVSRAARPSGRELSSPLSLLLVPWPPLPGISAAGPRCCQGQGWRRSPGDCSGVRHPGAGPGQTWAEAEG